MTAIAANPAATGDIIPPSTGTDPKPFRFTREQYYRLGELGFFNGKRVELIRGEVVEMSPISWAHTVAKTKVFEALRPVFAGTGTVMEQTPHPMKHSDPEPDVRVIAGRMEDYTDHPRDALLVVEVSDSTLRYDTTTKAELYAESRVADYWVLDLVNRQLHVFRDPGSAGYRTHQTLGAADTIAPLAAPRAAIRVADLLP